MLSKTILYATTNPGKLFEVGRLLKRHGIKIISPKDLRLEIDVPEDGLTLEENAAAQARAYLESGIDIPIIADDTGVEINALGGEPGIHVRRWKDKETRMSDQEVIDYCLYKMKDIPKGKRGAQFRTAVALAYPDNPIETFDGILRGEILEKPIPLKVEGFPFESIFYIPKWKMILGEVHQLPTRKAKSFLVHRELAITKALPEIKKLLLNRPSGFPNQNF